MQGSSLHQPVKDNFVYNNQQKLLFLESPVLDYESSAFRYKKYTAVLKSGKRFEQRKMKDTCWVVQRLFIIVCSWDPIMEKSLIFKSRKWRWQFVIFWRCHRWASGATVCCCCCYLLFLIISFGYCKRESSSLFFVGFIVVLEEIWAYNVCFLQLADCCSSYTMIRKRFSHLL